MVGILHCMGYIGVTINSSIIYIFACGCYRVCCCKGVVGKGVGAAVAFVGGKYVIARHTHWMMMINALITGYLKERAYHKAFA